MPKNVIGNDVPGTAKKQTIRILLCRYSSVVEHVIGNDGVVSPILTSGTIKKASAREAFLMVLLYKWTNPVIIR